MKIDLVYLWCNGDDPEWRRRRAQFIESGSITDEQSTCEGRIADNSDLRYSLRSVELYAPWINHIYIVTDRQCPEWLNTSHPKITLVDHNSLFESRHLPLYNSCALELGIHKIEGLSEHYIYANDDMMLFRPLTPDFFFTPDGRAKCRFIITDAYRGESDTYFHTINEVNAKIVSDFGAEYDMLYPHHQIDAYVKSSVKECIERYSEWAEKTLSHTFRSAEDMQRHILSLYAVATGRGIIENLKRPFLAKVRELYYKIFAPAKASNSLLVGIEKRGIYLTVKLLRPALLCFNDSQRATPTDRQRIKRLYQRLYPTASSFEM